MGSGNLDQGGKVSTTWTAPRAERGGGEKKIVVYQSGIALIKNRVDQRNITTVTKPKDGKTAGS